MPEIGQHVKCILRAGAIAEGIVEEWLDNTVQLRSLDGESILIIPHPSEDIMLIKIMLVKPSTQQYEEKIPSQISGELEQNFEDAHNLSTEDPKRIETLAKLRVMLAEQEKKIIAEKVKNHSIGDVRKVKYGQPGFLKKQST